MIDMNEMLKKAQELSETMKQQQEELAKLTFSVSVRSEEHTSELQSPE